MSFQENVPDHKTMKKEQMKQEKCLKDTLTNPLAMQSLGKLALDCGGLTLHGASTFAMHACLRLGC